ncbi:MAG: hypothetical protein H6880_00350 [Rhodobiaceae bacterium]|nr:hypothetical protein [Rhodobiaceae bacterium]
MSASIGVATPVRSIAGVFDAPVDFDHLAVPHEGEIAGQRRTEPRPVRRDLDLREGVRRLAVVAR